MIKLRCGCSVTEEGRFILGESCEAKGCKECASLRELHPFGEKRLSDLD